RHDGGIAGNVLAEMARDGARIEIVGAADAIADVEIDVLAFEKIRRRLRVGKGHRRSREERGGNAAHPTFKTHHLLPDRTYCLFGLGSKPGAGSTRSNQS